MRKHSGGANVLELGARSGRASQRVGATADARSRGENRSRVVAGARAVVLHKGQAALDSQKVGVLANALPEVESALASPGWKLAGTGIDRIVREERRRFLRTGWRPAAAGVAGVDVGGDADAVAVSDPWWMVLGAGTARTVVNLWHEFLARIDALSFFSPLSSAASGSYYCGNAACSQCGAVGGGALKRRCRVNVGSFWVVFGGARARDERSGRKGRQRDGIHK